MSGFMNMVFEIIGAMLYNLVDWVVGFVTGFIKILFTGWIEYATIFVNYFREFNVGSKILSIIFALVVIGLFVLIIVLIVKKITTTIKIKANKDDKASLYKEIGRLNKQVLDLIDEKNRILAMKMDPASEGLFDDEGKPLYAAGGSSASAPAVGGAGGVVTVRKEEDKEAEKQIIRFPKLVQVDERYADYVQPEYNETITLVEFADAFRRFCASQLNLYYTPEIVRRYIAGMAGSKIMILEGISGTGKTSLPYAFSRFVNNPATIVSIQPSFRDRTEIIGYFNEFSKRFNETEFLRGLYEANYREEPNTIVLDEMNLARVEYYFAEMLSILEMPSHDEWILDLVPTSWEKDPVLLEDGKIHVRDNTWFIGTANSDDSTFTITDKVYDRAMPIEINERADAFQCEPQGPVHVRSDHLKILFDRAKREHSVSQTSYEKLGELDQYLQAHFKMAFGNRITKQMFDFVPVYMACGGTEVGGMDYIIARKVLKKFESMNIAFVRDEIKGLIIFIEKTFGKKNMPDSVSYLMKIQNLY